MIQLRRHTETQGKLGPPRNTVTADPRLGIGTREFRNL